MSFAEPVSSDYDGLRNRLLSERKGISMERRGNRARASTRRVVLGGATGLAGALLAACGGAAPAAQIDTKNRAPVTIRSWIGEPNNERFPATQAADTAIKAKYPHINIQHEVKPSGSQIEMTVAGAA